MPISPSITREISPLPSRRDDAHKGDVGRLLIVGGRHDDLAMVGAPALAANAAVRSGAGLVQLLLPADLCIAALTIAPCATARVLSDSGEQILKAAHEFGADVLAIGPGLGLSIAPSTFAEVVVRFAGPIVVDADGLNLLAAATKFSIPNPQRIVLTPHVGEAKRLLISRGHDVAIDTTTARREAACLLAEEFQCVIVLKGRGTLVTNGERLYINDTGNPGMATGGSGDVLTGIVTALLCQGLPSFDAARLGAHVHGIAGDLAAAQLGQVSLIASDLIDYLPPAFQSLEVHRS